MSFDITLSIYSRCTDQSPAPEKSEVIEEILCEARRQKRSIVDLCEHFGVRCSRAKFTNQNDFYFFSFKRSRISVKRSSSLVGAGSGAGAGAGAGFSSSFFFKLER